MRKVILIRTHETAKQTLGRLLIFEEEEKLFECVTLELPWKENVRNVSCIPPGTYRLSPRHTETRGDHWHVTNVTGRNWILIHAGNFYTDIQGCILPGAGFTDLNADGELDVTFSGRTLTRINEVLGIQAVQISIFDGTQKRAA